MMGRWLMLIFFIGFSYSCGKKDKKYPKLEMTADEIVHALIQMYTINAAVNINDSKFRDSTSNVYFKQVAKITGKPVSVIKSDFSKLEQMQDSLLVLQNRAVDSLRAMQERHLLKPSPASIGLN